MMKSMVTPKDMALKNRLFRFTTPEALPLSFRYGERVIHGVPAEFSPQVEIRRVDANLMTCLIRGQNAQGLEIRVEYTEYLDYPMTELVAFFTNNGTQDTPILSDIKIADGLLPCENAVLVHGNGDTCKPDGYEWFRNDLSAPLSVGPVDGTSCNGAFPYMRLCCDGMVVSLAIGWPSRWQADFAKGEGGVCLRVGQKRCHTLLHPGETLRTPRLNLMACEGDETRSANMWRRWYMAHILPRENGQPLPPKCCMHVFCAEGKPEFTAASEKNQLGGLQDYLRENLRPDVWWIDAGWYPCDYEWTHTGTWKPDIKRFPNGLTPIGQACEENGIDFLLWFEPERVRPGTELAEKHPEWLITLRREDGSLGENMLLNLGDKECCDALIEHVDALIKQSHVHIYRQDFNFNPAPYWEQAEADDRIGALENFHMQGYLRYWDALLTRNPGLWIDSCASGGRRNDLETMRRAVPLHYTDVGYGHHPIKQKQHNQMFEWIPYFRAHNMNWDDPQTGEYGKTSRAPDRFAYYAAMTPSLTDTIEHDASNEAFALAREMQAIWRKAAAMMLECDFYPLTACRKSAEDFYAVQFHDPDCQRGFLQILRNNRCSDAAYIAKLRALEENTVYRLTHAESGEVCEYTGGELLNGVAFELPLRSGVIYFYERKQEK